MESSSLTIHSLPKEVFFEIFGHLSEKELARLSRVDKKLADMVRKSKLWESLVRRDFSTSRIPIKLLHGLFLKVKNFVSSDSKAPSFSEGEWKILYGTLASKWHQAKTIEDKKKVAETEKLDIKQKQIAASSALCEAICTKDPSAVSKNLELIGDNLEIFKISYTHGSVKERTPLFLAAFYQPKVFPYVLEKIKNNKEILKLNVADDPVLLILLQNGQITCAISLIEALEGDTDSLITGKTHYDRNVFHALAYTVAKEETIVVIAETLFKNSDDLIVHDLMLSQTSTEKLLPLHSAIECENLPLTKLYIQKLKELNILSTCLLTRNEMGKTPLDLALLKKQSDNWPDLI